ncbi:MAG: T9SS type A sorting domain-containing protein [Saprospiraceae bacterium]|nr:T9SS type A sorting domain-containing protein [Saprospiraceae bacterium]
MKILSFFALFIMSFLQLQGQIWDSKNIDFALPSQGWRIRAVNENVAWTFGFTIEDDSFGSWLFTDSEHTCQRTADGGNTWEESSFKPFEQGAGYICDVEGVSDQLAFLSYFNYNEGPILYKTTDGGTSWTPVNPGVDVFLNWVQFYDANNGIAFGDPGADGFFEIAYTSDGGVTWTQIDNNQSIEVSEADEYGVYGDYATSGDYIYTRSDYDRIFYSSNRGRTWQVAEPPSSAAGGLWGLVSNDQADLFAVYNIDASNEFIVFKRNATSGEWTDITPSNSSGYVTGMASLPGTRTLLLNKHDDFADDQTFITLAGFEGGSSWLEVSKNQGYRSGFMGFFSAEVGYACEIPASFDKPTDNVFVYNGTPITGLYNQQALDQNLALFPNPAVDHLNLEMEADDVCDYYIYVYDISGKLLEKKEIFQSSGIHECLSISHLTKGEYTVTISNSVGFLSQKFVKK